MRNNLEVPNFHHNMALKNPYAITILHHVSIDSDKDLIGGYYDNVINMR